MISFGFVQFLVEREFFVAIRFKGTSFYISDAYWAEPIPNVWQSRLIYMLCRFQKSLELFLGDLDSIDSTGIACCPLDLEDEYASFFEVRKLESGFRLIYNCSTFSARTHWHPSDWQPFDYDHYFLLQNESEILGEIFFGDLLALKSDIYQGIETIQWILNHDEIREYL